MSGNILPDERLPTVRELATELRINPNTAARAYQSLEREGVVETRRGLGTFVCDIKSDKLPADLRKLIESRLDEIILQALHLNLDRKDIVAIFGARLDELAPETRGTETTMKTVSALPEKGTDQ